nr:MAG TPA: hypothetical protein [Caudoviricetes sp.]
MKNHLLLSLKVDNNKRFLVFYLTISKRIISHRYFLFYFYCRTNHR